METIQLHTGQEMPVIGYGTWKSEADQVFEGVKTAISCGYTHIDCARVYGNEDQVGDALKAKMDDGTVTRDQLFITSKLWNSYHRVDLVRKCLEESFASLKLTYLDLYLIHWPVALKEDGEMIPRDQDGNVIFSDADYLDSYKVMEQLVDEGLVKAIGLSNFHPNQIQRVLDNCRIKPAMVQVEIHPYLNQQEIIDFCRSRDIPVTAYSPFGSPDRPWAVAGEQTLLEDERITEIAKRQNMTPAQVLIRYATQRGLVVLAKSVTASRIQSNIQATDFRLSDADMAAMGAMQNGYRACLVAHWAVSKYYPFNDSAF